MTLNRNYLSLANPPVFAKNNNEALSPTPKPPRFKLINIQYEFDGDGGYAYDDTLYDDDIGDRGVEKGDRRMYVRTIG